MPEIGVVGDIMETLRFRSSVFFRSPLAAPWGFTLAERSALRFHISIGGRFYVGSEEDSDPVEVGEMEIVILPSDRQHWIADRPGRRLVPSERAAQACELGSPLFQDGAITNLVICGNTSFDAHLGHPLFESLPTLIHFPRFEVKSPIWRLVELIDAETEHSPVLETTILDRLTEVLFLKLLQEFIDHGEGPIGFVAALRDRQIRRALELLHWDPATTWTLESLAKEAALSRATLVRRFRESVGLSPMDYLSRWRLLKAHQLAQHSDESIERIAVQVGFSSAQTLTRAFKRRFGVTPSSLRR